MSSSEEVRASLALQQAALVNALVTGCAPPAGFDPHRVRAAAESLARKRAKSAARAWPGLASAMGKTFDEHFVA